MTDMGKVVWITGASSGIGEALAAEYSRRGAIVVLTARRESELERVRAQLAHPDRAYVVPWDVTREDEAPAIVKRVLGLAGRIDVLVNNAGIDYKDWVRNTSMEVHRKIMDVDYFSHIALTSAVLGELKPGAQVVSVTSVNGLLSDKCSSAYAAAKHALHGFYDALRAEHPELVVSVVVPGYVRTPITINSLNGAGAAFGEYSAASLKGMPTDTFAAKAVAALERHCTLIVIAGPLERTATVLQALAPRLLYRITRRLTPEYENVQTA
jgi:short-subunit dehydrogenase